MTMPATAALASVLLKRWGIRAASPVGVGPLNPERCRFAGRAATMRYLPLREDLEKRFSTVNPEAPSFDAFDTVQPGQVVVIEAEARADAGILGGIMAARLVAQGAAGVVCDAAMRDVSELRALGLPVFCRGAAPGSSSASLMLVEQGRPVALGGCTVMPDDWVVGDEDGVVVCPAALWDQALVAVAEREAMEAAILPRIRAGTPLRGLYPPATPGPG